MVLVEAADFEVVGEGEFLLGPAFSLSSFGKADLEPFVHALKKLLLFGSGHEEKVGELRVALPEIIPHPRIHRADVICDAEIVIFWLNFFCLGFLGFRVTIGRCLGEVGGVEILLLKHQDMHLDHFESPGVEF